MTLLRRAKSAKRLSQALVRKRLLNAWEEAFSEGLGMDSAQAERILRAVVGEKGHADFSEAVFAVVRKLFGHIGRRALREEAMKIKTEDDLEGRIAEIRRGSYDMTSEMRKALKVFASKLPRRGGPGRKPKLSAKDERVACDQIAVFIRQGHNFKEALQRTAAVSATLLGKPVGARTLQKAWKRRSTSVEN